MEMSKVLYFDEPGPSNTEKILKLSKERMEILKIHHVIIATSVGFTVRSFLKMCKNRNFEILVVTSDKGKKMPCSFLYDKYPGSKRIKEHYLKEGVKDFPISIDDETLMEFEKKGIKVFFVPDIFGIGGTLGPEGEKRTARTKLDPFLPRHLRPLDIEAGADLSLLNIISMGFRVCVGMTAVAVKNGFVPKGETVLSIAGTGFAGGGADTAVIIQADPNPRRCYIREILGFPKLK